MYQYNQLTRKSCMPVYTSESRLSEFTGVAAGAPWDSCSQESQPLRKLLPGFESVDFNPEPHGFELNIVTRT